MPPKDDDDPASTKEVVTKKQKQLLNREELNLAAIAEAFGGFLIEKKRENRGSSRGGGEGFENQKTENKPQGGGARSGGKSKGDKPVTVNPRSIDPDESAVRAAEADYESDLRKGKTDPMSGSPRPDDRGFDRKSYRDLMRDVLKDPRAAAVSRGGRGGSGGERSRTTRRSRPNPKPTAQTGVGFDPRTSARKDTADAIAAQDTPEVRRTPKVGGPEGGYRAPAQPTPANAALQPQADPLAITKYRAKATPSGTNIPSASGGDAGAAVRRAMQQRATKSAPRSPYARGSGLVGAAAYELSRGPTERLGNYLGYQLARGIASVSSPEVKKKLSTYSPNLVDKQGPTLTKDIIKGIQGREKQAAIDFYTSPEVKSQLDAITKTQTQTQTQTQTPSTTKTRTDVKDPKDPKTPSTTKTRTDVKDPKDPKTPPVKTLPIPVVPPVAKRPTTGQRNKTGGRKVPGPGLPRIGMPGYRGKIGRRSNPQ